MSEIVIVEDYENDARLLERALRAGGVLNRIHHIWNSGQAINYLFEAERQPGAGEPARRIILLDIKLPGHSGFDMLTLMKGRKCFSNTLRIVVSQLDDTHSVKRAYDLGANSFLGKPVSQAELAAIIHAFPDYWELSEDAAAGFKLSQAREINGDELRAIGSDFTTRISF